MLARVLTLGNLTLDLFFPKWCVGCGKYGKYFCPDCSRHLPRIHGPLCPRCGRPQTNHSLCPACVKWAASIDGIRAPFRFEGVVRQAVYNLKYHNVRTLAQPLAALMHGFMISQGLVADIIIPVPLHKKRLKERGYNQSALIARNLGKMARLPVVEDWLVKQKHTCQQAKTSSLKERLKNVAGAFSCRSSGINGLSVILIDDVATSGATMDAAAGALKDSGAASVWGLALAKEI